MYAYNRRNCIMEYKCNIHTFYRRHGLIRMQFIPFRPEIVENTRVSESDNILWRFNDRIMCHIKSFKFWHQAYNKNLQLLGKKKKLITE